MRRARPPEEAPETGRAAPAGQAAPAPKPTPRRRRHRPHRFGLEHAVGVVLRLGLIVLSFLVLAAGAIWWRLSEGPLSLSILTPQLEAALTPSDGAFRVEIADTIIALNRDEGAVEIVGREVRLLDAGNRTVAAVPELGIGLSLAAAARWMVAPTRVVVREPKLRLLRDEEGSFRLLPQERAEEAEGAGLATFLEELAHAPDPARPSGYLTEVAMQGGAVEVDDRRLGRTWRAERLDLRALRGQEGLDGHVSASVAIGDASGTIDGAFTYHTGSGRVIAAIGVEGLRPANFAGLAPALKPLETLEASIGGRARLTLNVARSRVEASRLDLTVGPGRIVRPELPGGAVAVAGGRVVADYDPFAARLVVEQALLDLGGPVLEATGTIDGLRLDPGLGSSTEPLQIAADAVARNVPASELDRLWPTEAADGAREWVTENIRDGVVEEARATARLRLPPDDIAAATLDAFHGTLRYRDLVVHYLRPLPPVRGVSGTASFDRKVFDLKPTTGQLLGVKVTSGLIHIYDLDTGSEKLAIDLAIEGPVRDVMTVIDQKPLGYAREVGIDPALTSGTAQGKLGFRFPLIRDLKFSHVELAVTATLENVGIRNLVFDADATEGVIDLALDRNGLKLQGGAKLGGVAAAVSLAHNFKPDRSGVATRYTVWSLVDKAGRERLDLDLLPDMVDGPVAVDASITERPGKRRQVALALGLKDATLIEELIGYQKVPGVPATARMLIELDDDRPLQIRDLDLRAPDLDVKGTIRFKDKDVERVELTRLRAGATDVAGTVTRRPEGGWRIDATGASWDGSLLAVRSDDENEPDPPPFIVDARVQRVTLGPGREARDVAVQLFSSGRHYEMARIDAALGEKGTLALRFGQAGGSRDFQLTTDDFGATLKLADINENFVGGRLTVDGRVEEVNGKRVLKGRAEGADFRMRNAPTFAKLLSVASLPSLASLVGGEGLPFTRLTGGFELSRDRLVLDKARAYGGAVGINASGFLDRRNDTLELSGTLVPAYTINNILGNIPLIGNLIQGGEGQGLFAATFKAVGPAGDPTITVNPLSALAPGFLKNLFLFDVPGASGQTAQEPAPSPPPPQGGQ